MASASVSGSVKVGTSATASLGSGKGGTTSDKLKLSGKAYEDTGAKVNPMAAAVVEMRDAIFALAGELGIRREVETVYFDATQGARIGAVGGAVYGGATAVAAGGVVTAGAVAGGAAIGLAAGGLVGAAIGVFAIIGGGEDEAHEAYRKKYKERVTAFRKAMLSRLTLAQFAEEQSKAANVAEANASMVRKMPDLFGPFVNLKEQEKLATTGRKMALFFSTVPQRFDQLHADLFESCANLTRWNSYKAGYVELAKQQRKQAKKYPVIAAAWEKQAAETDSYIAKVEMLLAKETAHFAELVTTAQAASGGETQLSKAIRKRRASFDYWKDHTSKGLLYKLGAFQMKHPPLDQRGRTAVAVRNGAPLAIGAVLLAAGVTALVVL